VRARDGLIFGSVLLVAAVVLAITVNKPGVVSVEITDPVHKAKYIELLRSKNISFTERVSDLGREYIDVPGYSLESLSDEMTEYAEWERSKYKSEGVEYYDD
jgi:hypothetical protein